MDKVFYENVTSKLPHLYIIQDHQGPIYTWHSGVCWKRWEFEFIPSFQKATGQENNTGNTDIIPPSLFSWKPPIYMKISGLYFRQHC